MTMFPKDCLIVDRFSSKCGNCGKSADPNEKAHDTLLGYGSDNGKPGCGQVWTKIAPVYIDPNVDEQMHRLRPDLTLINPWSEVIDEVRRSK